MSCLAICCSAAVCRRLSLSPLPARSLSAANEVLGGCQCSLQKLEGLTESQKEDMQPEEQGKLSGPWEDSGV